MAVATSPVIREAMLQGLSAHFPSALQHLSTLQSCQLGETLYYQGDPAAHWYRLVSGAARKSALMSDGRRQIVSFLLPGDVFGFGAVKDVHQFSVEVIAAGTVVARYPHMSVEMLAASNPEVSRQVCTALFESISRLQMRMVLLGRSSALEKVCAFLLEMADRSPSTDSVFLPMSRYDIADYLAIAVETVSRALTLLRSRGAIAFCGTRHLKIIDRTALEEGGNGRCASLRSNDLMKIG